MKIYHNKYYHSFNQENKTLLTATNSRMNCLSLWKKMIIKELFGHSRAEINQSNYQ